MRQTVPHTLAPQEAKDLVHRVLETYRQHYPEHSVEGDWVDGDTARVGFELTGRRIEGRIRVCPDRFDIDVDLPWVLRPFGTRIASAVEGELRRWMAHAERQAS